ncbi:hypothetical protein MSG28_011933 [Choristoneura fumiferana]|uniref:Uncharacterized protein n=1 Tax=Choristoneura fumiferana TaxID=7141 RepID=A0ACC0KN16_CHOFU|nr:hypothetical protein MSG28_011933 [Choristoneura fumiferana]
MEPLLLVAALLILAAPSYQLRMDSLDDVLVYPLEAPVKVQKRAVPKKSDSFDDFIEEKLMQHSQALEQLVRMVQQNEDVTKQLIENISLRLEKPKLPEKVEFTRRSLDGRQVTVPGIKPQSKSPWCRVALICKRTIDPVCAFDDNFGYGRFDDVCHMIQVNCFWKYNFSVVSNCKPPF